MAKNLAKLALCKFLSPVEMKACPEYKASLPFKKRKLPNHGQSLARAKRIDSWGIEKLQVDPKI